MSCYQSILQEQKSSRTTLFFRLSDLKHSLMRSAFVENFTDNLAALGNGSCILIKGGMFLTIVIIYITIE